MEKIAVVTGSSSGIGFETSLALARDGYFTYAIMERYSKAIKETEGAFMKILENSKTLLHVIKRENQTVIDKDTIFSE